MIKQIINLITMTNHKLTKILIYKRVIKQKPFKKKLMMMNRSHLQSSSFFFLLSFLFFSKVNEEGIEENDIQLVMSQSKATRSKAVKTLRKCNNDIVNAIMVRFISFQNIFFIGFYLGIG